MKPHSLAYVALELEQIWHDHCLYPASQLPEHQARRILALHQYIVAMAFGERDNDTTEQPVDVRVLRRLGVWKRQRT